ncbi:hypothetical protein V6N11_007533 [Hibiscus sabdariffa]|uniref:Uncharacterized protein n=2 Tax=Hibiscus sabdariffa TaxID=183260 RepID=A0ABR2NSC7_9ROSI
MRVSVRLGGKRRPGAWRGEVSGKCWEVEGGSNSGLGCVGRRVSEGIVDLAQITMATCSAFHCNFFFFFFFFISLSLSLRLDML